MPKVWNKRDKNCPKDAVYVGRPSKWGNPYKIGRDGTREQVIEKYKLALDSVFNAQRKGLIPPRIMLNLAELRGKDLSCWCAPLPCHADVLLELANGVPAKEEAV